MKRIILSVVVSFVLSAMVLSGCENDQISFEIPLMQMSRTNSVKVMWETEEPVKSCVSVWPLDGVEEREAQRSCSSGTRMHEIVIDGLRADVPYGYRVIPQQPDEFAPIHSFWTAKPDGEPFSFAVVGDSHGNRDVLIPILDAAYNGGYGVDFFVHTGDAVDDGADQSGWFFDLLEPGSGYLSSVPLFAARGNHESDLGLFRYYHSYPTPENYYAVNYSNTLFVFIDTNEEFSPGSGQYKWLKDKLASPEARAATWRFAVFHHPPYSEGWHECGEFNGDKRVRRWLVPLLEQNRVHVAFSGHTHGYERGQVGNVMYITSGGGGGELDHSCGDLTPVQFAEYAHHYVRVDVSPDELRLVAQTPAGEQIDVVELLPRPTYTTSESRD